MCKAFVYWKPLFFAVKIPLPRLKSEFGAITETDRTVQNSLLHDNARPHISRMIPEKLAVKFWNFYFTSIPKLQRYQNNTVNDVQFKIDINSIAKESLI